MPNTTTKTDAERYDGLERRRDRLESLIHGALTDAIETNKAVIAMAGQIVETTGALVDANTACLVALEALDR
jgi:hypothetical protein